MDLVEFLRARLDDDEAQALAASPGPWSPNAESDEVTAVDGITVCDGFALSNNQLRATVEHIARHDPVRVLADVESTRKIVDRCEREMRSYVGTGAQAATPYLVLRLLALRYASDPAYREEWKP